MQQDRDYRFRVIPPPQSYGLGLFSARDYEVPPFQLLGLIGRSYLSEKMCNCLICPLLCLFLRGDMIDLSCSFLGSRTMISSPRLTLFFLISSFLVSSSTVLSHLAFSIALYNYIDTDYSNYPCSLPFVQSQLLSPKTTRCQSASCIASLRSLACYWLSSSV